MSVAEIKSIAELRLEEAKILGKMKILNKEWEILNNKHFKLHKKIAKIEREGLIGKCYRTSFRYERPEYRKVLAIHKGEFEGWVKILAFEIIGDDEFTISVEDRPEEGVTGVKEISNAEFSKVFNPLYRQLQEILKEERKG